jgi:hypothetical protein
LSIGRRRWVVTAGSRVCGYLFGDNTKKLKKYSFFLNLTIYHLSIIVYNIIKLRVGNERSQDMKYEIGQKLIWVVDEFDGSFQREAVLVKVEEDHAIAECDGMSLWIDEDTEEQFKVA